MDKAWAAWWGQTPNPLSYLSDVEFEFWFAITSLEKKSQNILSLEHENQFWVHIQTFQKF